MVEAEDDIEQTLHIARSVSVYRIPPRPGATGWRSGEWLVSDKLFSGRLRMVAKGELCEVRLEDPNSGDLFAMCPVQYGQRNVCVEPVTDSSRYYVLRVEDPTTHRHAFLGMGFDNRSDAFDFNEALVRHEQQVARERATRARATSSAAAAAAASTPPATSSSSSTAAIAPAAVACPAAAPTSWGAAGASSSAAAEVEGLYRRTADLRLQEGQTIRVNVSGLKKSGTPATTAAAASTTGKGLLSGAGTAPAVPSPPSQIGLAPPPVPVGVLAPPPPPLAPLSSSSSPSGSSVTFTPPPVASYASNTRVLESPPLPSYQTLEQRCHQPDEPSGAVFTGSPTTPNVTGSSTSPQICAFTSDSSLQQPVPCASGQDNWATFD